MLKQQMVEEFINSYPIGEQLPARGIGVECEIPIVTEKGKAVTLPVIQEMFAYLQNIGFEPERDAFSGLLVAAQKPNPQSPDRFGYSKDTVTTDTAYSTVEIVLAPQDNLQAVQSSLSKLISILAPFFKSHNCLMLGYGIQPVSLPSRNLLMPKERYCFFEKFSANRYVPASIGADSSFLNLTASNQCHIGVTRDESIVAVNVLNALSGLQIALHANSPIWRGKIDPNYKANREMIWHHCFPDRLNQVGIPPAFDSIEAYFEYLISFKPLLVKRNGQYYQILNKNSFADFLEDEVPTLARSLEGRKITIAPEASDIQELIPFSWFNARLVPAYGTVESRMCCQQPPNEMLTSTAVTLGLIENLEVAQRFSQKLPLNKWRQIRTKAAQNGLEKILYEENLIPLLLEFLDLARTGLLRRNRDEEKYLLPLYERIAKRKGPADFAVEAFRLQGIDGLLRHTAFKHEYLTEHSPIHC